MINQTKKIQILEKVIELLNSELPLDKVLENIISMLSAATSADSCLIYIYDDRTSELVLYASKNPHPGILKKLRLKIGEGITGWAAKEKKPIVIPENAGTDPRFKFFHNIPEDKYEAFLSIPIVFRNTSIGVVNIQHRLKHHFTKAEVSFLFTVACQVGNAVSQAFLQEKERQKQERLKALSSMSETIISGKYIDQILNLIVVTACETLHTDICSIMLVDEKKNQLIVKAAQSTSEEYKNKPNIDIDKSLLGTVIKTKKALVVPDVLNDRHYAQKELAKKLGIVSMLSAPLLYQEKAIGVINAYTTSRRDFSQDEAGILQAIANQAAIAIENSALLDAVTKTKEELENRKIIEKAKGILMKAKGVSEDEAYAFLRKKSMDSCKPMKEIAQAVLLFSDLEK